LKERLGSKGTHRAYQFGPYGPDLTPEKRNAGYDFVWLGVAIAGWTALYDIAEIDVLPRQVDRLEDLCQQLTSLANKRHPLQVFFVAWTFTYQDQSSPGVSSPKDDVFTLLVELAPPAVTKIVLNHLKGLCLRPFAQLLKDFHRPFGQSQPLVS
jgi:hypothetical protein